MSLVLVYPYTGAPSDTVTLRSPVLGDSDQLQIQTRFKRVMSGVLHSYKKTPATRKVIWRILALTDLQITQLRSFIEASAGEDIKITDHLARVWKAKIISTIFEDVDNDNCKNETTLNFEGTVI